MGTSTNGMIAFGTTFEEDFPFPWDNNGENKDDNGIEGDLDEWWMKQNRYKPLEDPYNAEGNYADGFDGEDPRVNAYHEHKDKWLEENPLPVEMENYCSGDYPMHALIVPSSLLTCLRGGPTNFSPKDLSVTIDELRKFSDFLDKYEIKTEHKPSWLLMSYWG